MIGVLGVEPLASTSNMKSTHVSAAFGKTDFTTCVHTHVASISDGLVGPGASTGMHKMKLFVQNRAQRCGLNNFVMHDTCAQVGRVGSASGTHKHIHCHFGSRMVDCVLCLTIS